MEVSLAEISAGTDCVISRVHRQICVAQLQVLVEGAVLARTQLWG
jgi:hypothetical protein